MRTPVSVLFDLGSVANINIMFQHCWVRRFWTIHSEVVSCSNRLQIFVRKKKKRKENGSGITALS